VNNSYRSLPSVDELLQLPAAVRLIEEYGRPLTLEAVRQVLDDLRSEIREGISFSMPLDFLAAAGDLLAKWLAPSLVPVINATGVVLHTNLGRAPLATSALNAINSQAAYCTLEYDLANGERGSRTLHAEELLKRITGAQAALVVNNNAAAVLLSLSTLARNHRVIISRTQLVEIGGGFRVPDVMKQSGAKLVEVGTTNRVHLSDYELALQEPTAMVLRAHSSNFRMIGFTSEPSFPELVEMAHSRQVMVMDDIGSGALLDTSRFGMAHEPMVQESIACGADLVCFSGDKLVGGPQAGIIVGKAELIARIKRHSLYRAMRADKICLAALVATLLHYVKNEAECEIPVWKMISMRQEAIQERAARWQIVLGGGEMIKGESTVGGGSLPGEVLPTYLLALSIPNPSRFLKRLRQAQPPVIARIQDNRVVLDPRTVPDKLDDELLSILKQALSGSRRGSSNEK
jgi:L-seryl-tRNA(Ser) seleniumtransferase